MVLLALSALLPTVQAQTPTEGEEIDLGLSVNWRAYDLGSTTPSTPGTLYAYGVPTPSNYSSMYNYPLFSWDTYTAVLPEGGISGIPEYDAAAAETNGKWRIATKAEWEELIDGCDAQVISVDGHDGYLFTSKTNGNSIFIPDLNYFLKYYTADNSGSSAYFMQAGTYYGAPTVRLQNPQSRENPWIGLPLRPVCNKESVPLESIVLTADYTEIFVNTYAQLTATAVPEEAIVRGTYSSSDESVATVTSKGLVKGLGAGSAVITLTDGEISASVSITVAAAETDLSQPSVDLGLSVDWKTVNEGAESYSGWGTTYPFATATQKTYETAFDYPYYNSSSLKYNFPLENFCGNPTYDAVALTSGEDSRMRLPSKIEMDELVANCVAEAVTIEDTNYVRFTSKVNGRYILFPLNGTSGTYYSGSTNADRNKAIAMSFSMTGDVLTVNVYEMGQPYKSNALRGVVEHLVIPDLTEITLDISEAEIYTENTIRLTAAAVPVGALLDGIVWHSSNEAVATVDSEGIVTGVSAGEAVISAAVGEISASANITVKDPGICLDEMVDMGTDVLWAPCELGASTPSDRGPLYYWGSLVPRTDNTADMEQWTDPGIEDIGATMYDVVYREKGKGWRIPTRSEFWQLVQNCTFEWIVNGGHKGALITSKTTGNRMFFPLAEDYNFIFYFGDKIFWNNSSDGLPFVEGLFIEDKRFDCLGQYPWKPFPMRPVFDPSFVPPLESIRISSESDTFEMTEGETMQLLASPFPEDAVFGNLVWSSSDETVATVDAESKVSGISDGTAIISAADGDIRASVVVEVKPLSGLNGNAAFGRVVEGIYTAEGIRVAPDKAEILAPGAYIIKYSDGSAEKILRR